MNRRRFAFWLGFGMFSVGYKLRLDRLDALAASLMQSTEPASTTTAATSAVVAAESAPVHWRAVANEGWRWYERETFLKGKWKVTGITTPININKDTGEAYAG